VVSSLERYAQGNYDDAVKQVIGAKSVRPIVKDFRKNAGAWIDGAPAPERAQRIAVVGAMSLELMAATFNQHVDDYSESRVLIEWACERFRQLPPSEVERWFHLAAIALAQGAGDKKFIDGNGRRFNFLDKHAEHPTERFPREVRFRLAIATANPEAQQIATWLLPPGYMVDPAVTMIEHQFERQLLDSSLQMLMELFDDPVVSTEARLRSGVLRFLRGDTTVAGTDLEHAEQAKDPVIRHVAHLMLGTIADQAGDASEALRHYRLAYETVPAATASVALASRLFRSGAAEEAAAVLRAFDAAVPPADPWELYGQRDFRSFTVFRHEMRKALAGVLMRPLPAEPPAAQGPATPLNLTQSRAATTGMRLPVLVQSDGEPVTDLKAADFRLIDSGVLQDILAVDTETRALDVTVVAQETTQAKSGKFQALDAEIAAVAKALTPADRLTVMLVGRDPRPFTPPGTRDLVKESYIEQRCVPVYDTLARALITPPSLGRHRVVILLTGSEGTGGFLSTGPAAEIARRASAQLYVARIEPAAGRRGHYIAEAVCPRVSMDFSKDREVRLRLAQQGLWENDQRRRLVEIAESTGGREIRPAIFRESTIAPLRDMLDEIRASYLLRYTPQGVPASGWHPITVKVTKPGSYDIRVRTGYER